MRASVLRMEALQAMRTQESNRLEVARDVVAEDLVGHIEWLDTEIKKLLRKIRGRIDGAPDMKGKQILPDSLPELCERTIAVLLAFCMHPGRLANAGHAAAFAGLDPGRHESGSSVKGRPRVSKVGHAILRAALYMSAMTTRYNSHSGKGFRERLVALGKHAGLVDRGF